MKLPEFIRNNPAVIIGLIGAILSLAVSFGAKLTQEQTAAILALGQLVAGIVTRQFVTGPVTAAKLAAAGRVAAKVGQ